MNTTGRNTAYGVGPGRGLRSAPPEAVPAAPPVGSPATRRRRPAPPLTRQAPGSDAAFDILRRAHGRGGLPRVGTDYATSDACSYVLRPSVHRRTATPPGAAARLRVGTPFAYCNVRTSVGDTPAPHGPRWHPSAADVRGDPSAPPREGPARASAPPFRTPTPRMRVFCHGPEPSIVGVLPGQSSSQEIVKLHFRPAPNCRRSSVTVAFSRSRKRPVVFSRRRIVALAPALSALDTSNVNRFHAVGRAP